MCVFDSPLMIIFPSWVPSLAQHVLLEGTHFAHHSGEVGGASARMWGPSQQQQEDHGDTGRRAPCCPDEDDGEAHLRPGVFMKKAEPSGGSGFREKSKTQAEPFESAINTEK